MGLTVLTSASSLAPIFFGIYVRRESSSDHRICPISNLPGARIRNLFRGRPSLKDHIPVHSTKLVDWSRQFLISADVSHLRKVRIFYPHPVVLSSTHSRLDFRRRPSFLISAVLLCAGCIWAAMSGTSFDSHLGARLLMGFAAGATESTIPLIITDYTFLHERAKVFGLLSFVCRMSFPSVLLSQH